MLYACIPDGVPAFATTCVTAFAGAALLFVPFRARLAAAVRAGGWRFVAAVFGLAVLSASYNTLYLFGSKAFDVASGAFTFCMTVVVLPVVLLTMRRRVALETWISVALVLAGIVLALGPSLSAAQVPGLGFMGAGCLLRAVAIVGLADTAKLLVWWFWTRVSRTPFSLRTPRNLLRHCLLLVVMGAFETAIVAPAVALVYPEVDSVCLAWAVSGNPAGPPILLGIPLSILLQEELDIQPAGRSGAAPDDPRGDREPRRRSPGTPESPAP